MMYLWAFGESIDEHVILAVPASHVQQARERASAIIAASNLMPELERKLTNRIAQSAPMTLQPNEGSILYIRREKQ